ncbi:MULTISPECIES: AraC family transcriptional regulator [unclassified Janthinobacterium]|uniref:AraC family transcriptional regulator n=1 Tax=unclassified Janthinobacterium TaxID=2610881 RepID=UPI00088943E7|nr:MULTISPECIES: AraC family transcriptional regulator [unclassified Janthinobacterium]SDA54775.1 AraC-type DNA-binding protein [Janthinobacterium sp. 551a]SFB46314.1 AraC-type DNA-binding protein [Janthinobacterium sp. 344]
MTRRVADKQTDWVRRAAPVEGVERIEAWFHGNAYAMHRHDTYAIGRTLAGVQSFHYRRGKQNSLPGNTMVLHPDEAHDGQAGSEEGFQYRMIYVQPSLFQDVLGGQALPFLEGGVSSDARVAAATAALLQPVHHAIEALEQSDGLAELVRALAAVAGLPGRRQNGDFLAARRAREYLHARHAQHVTLEQLEHATGRDRWSLSHDFRLFYGTSPYRYLTMRRLDAVRRMLIAGTPLADAAVGAGFADQSHMTRHFSKAYGLTPGRWLSIVQGAAPG